METKENQSPLPLSKLKECMSSKTYEWLLESETENLTEQDASGFFMGAADEEDWIRVREWRSSTTNADGYGGYYSEELGPKESDNNSIKVKYILSDSSGGHGDDLWAASRHVSNTLANAESCLHLLSPLWKGQMENENTQHHPLVGLKLLELGAGAGLPSWTAMWCGAQVVSTDRSIPDRIRCMAESCERNLRDVKAMGLDLVVLSTAVKARVCPYDWGEPTTAVADTLGADPDTAKFEVIIAADCIYMPQFHGLLLDSIQLLLAETGVAILPFALHGNTTDENVWGIVGLAEEKGFQVEKLEPQQLTPQSYGMDAKRGLVHTIRLTRA